MSGGGDMWHTAAHTHSHMCLVALVWTNFTPFLYALSVALFSVLSLSHTLGHWEKHHTFNPRGSLDVCVCVCARAHACGIHVDFLLPSAHYCLCSVGDQKSFGFFFGHYLSLPPFSLSDWCNVWDWGEILLLETVLLYVRESALSHSASSGNCVKFAELLTSTMFFFCFFLPEHSFDPPVFSRSVCVGICVSELPNLLSISLSIWLCFISPQTSLCLCK